MIPGPEQFAAANVRPFQFTDERHPTAMREVLEPVTLVGEQGQRFSGLHLNRDYSGNPPIVRIGAWLNDSTGPDTKYTAYQLAAAHPENPILLIDEPAHGYSDRLTSAQRRQIMNNREVSLIVDSQKTAFRSRFPDSQEVIVTGESTGGRLALEFAAKVGEVSLKPKALIGFEVTGVDQRTSFGSTRTFFTDGHCTQDRYHQYPADQRLDESFDAFLLELANLGFKGRKYSLPKIYGKEPSFLLFHFMRSPLVGGRGFDWIEQALEINDSMIAAFVSAGLSKVSRWHKIEPGVRRLQELHPDRLVWQVWPHDTHAMGIAAQQPRMATFTQAVVNSAQTPTL